MLSGAEGLEVKELEAELIGYELLEMGCYDEWETVTYVVKISAENSSTDVSRGYLYVGFYLTVSEGEEAAERFWFVTPIYVEIAPETTRTIEETVVHGGYMDVIFKTIEESAMYLDYYLKSPRLEVETGKELECPYCNGTGRASFAEWLKVTMQ